jgi:hypothetical protein
MIKSITMLHGCAAAALIAAIGLSGSALAAPQRLLIETQKGTLTALNGSGATGTINMQLRGQRYLTVQIDATGLEPGTGHVGHIHGRVADNRPANSVCPTAAQDADHDRFVDLAEGQVTYGPIVIPFGDVDPDKDGTVHFLHTYDLNASSTFAAGFDKSDVLPLDLREVVLHGMTLQAGEGATTSASIAPNEADGTAGFKAVLPVTCGDIENRGRNPLEFVRPPHHSH